MELKEIELKVIVDEMSAAHVYREMLKHVKSSNESDKTVEIGSIFPEKEGKDG